MSYSDQSQQRRDRLMAALLGHAPTGAFHAGAAPLFGGAGRSFAGGLELPAAALPALSFNPFFAQHNAGVPNLAPPTNVTLPTPPGGGVPGGLPAQVPQAGVGGAANGSAPMASQAAAGAAPDSFTGVADPTFAYNPADVAVRRLFGNGSPSLTAYQQARNNNSYGIG